MKNLKDSITPVVYGPGLTIPDIDTIRSRMDYNHYELAYNSVLRDSPVELSAMTNIIITSKIASYCIC